MKIALLAPIDNSLYARLVAQGILQEPGLELTAVVVRTPWSLGRVRSEWRRDGGRLLEKIVAKYILAEKNPAKATPLEVYAETHGLHSPTLQRFCHEHHVPFLVVRNLNDRRGLDLFKKNIPDVIAFTGGGLLRKELLRIPRQGILNCHSGILPSYRGMDVVEWAILERHIDHIGLSLHFMAAGVDTGPILMKKSVQPQAGETIATLRLRMEPLMVDLMLAGLRQLRDGRIKPTPQKTTDGRQYFVMHPRLKKQAQELFTATFSNKK